MSDGFWMWRVSVLETHSLTYRGRSSDSSPLIAPSHNPSGVAMASCKVLQDIPLRAQFRLPTGFPFQDSSLTTIPYRDMDFSAHMPCFCCALDWHNNSLFSQVNFIIVL